MYNIKRVKFQQGANYDPNKIIGKYQSQGWNSLSPDEQKWYRTNHKNILPVDAEGTAYGGSMFSENEIDDFLANKRYQDRNYSNIVNDIGGGIASGIGHGLNAAGQTMGIPGAILAEGINAVRGKGFKPMNVLPDYMNPNSGFYGGNQKQAQVSNALGVTNPYAAMAVDMVADPALLMGVGKGLKNMGRFRKPKSTQDNAWKNGFDKDDFQWTDEEIAKSLGNPETIYPDWERPTALPESEIQRIKRHPELMFMSTPEEEINFILRNRQRSWDEEFDRLQAEARHSVNRRRELAQHREKKLNEYVLIPTKDGLQKIKQKPSTIKREQTNLIPTHDYLQKLQQGIPDLNNIIKKNNKTGKDFIVDDIRINDNNRLQFALKNANNDDITYHNYDFLPGEFSGDIDEFTNIDMFGQVPGLYMTNTTRGLPIADVSGAQPKGSGYYKSLNEFLKTKGLGRVKSGMNSQTEDSYNVWKNSIINDKAIGYQPHPGVIYGMMKSVPPIAAGLGAYQASQQKQQYQRGGSMIPVAMTPQQARTGLKNRALQSMYFPNSNNMTMKGMDTPVKYYGITNGQVTDEGVAYPGEDFKVNGKDTLEFRMPYQDGGYTLPEVVVRPDNRNQQLILQNMHKPMVSRMFDKKPLTYTHPGKTVPSTHSMGWGGGEKGNYVYPTLIKDGDKLRPIKEPIETKGNEFILPYDKFTDEEADIFSRVGYKQGADDLRPWFGGVPFSEDGTYDEYKNGGIYIKPQNRGKFTASANRAGMGVQEYARHILANKDKYNSTQVKRANFARNASKWNK